MKKFQRVQVDPDSVVLEELMSKYSVCLEEARMMKHRILSEITFRNDVYQVTMSEPHITGVDGWPPMIHLSINPLNGHPRHVWSEMQAIKNELVGPEYEAVEIFPSESRLVDMGHNYHLWVFAVKGFRVPMGWKTRMVAGEAR